MFSFVPNPTKAKNAWSSSTCLLYDHNPRARRLSPGRRKIRLIECISTVLILKNLPAKGLCGRCLICLRPTPKLPPLHTVFVYMYIVQYTYSYKEGARGVELTWKKVRGAIAHKAGRKYQHEWLYLQSINSIVKKTTLIIMCLYI
jgi:hypothetical protein